MAKTTGGVEVRAASIRLSFTASGVRHRRTLLIDGAAVLPTPANIKYTNRRIAEICGRIKIGSFSMAEYFPEEAEAAPTPEPPPVQAPQARVAAQQPPEEPPAGPTPTKRKAKDHTPAELTVEAWLTQWLGMTRIETSTRIGYDAAVKFWTRSPYDNRGRKMGTLPVSKPEKYQRRAARAGQEDAYRSNQRMRTVRPRRCRIQRSGRIGDGSVQRRPEAGDAFSGRHQLGYAVG